MLPTTFSILAAVSNLRHGVFGRHGGVSRPPYDSLNVAWTNGDQEDAVCRNLMRVKETLDFDTLVVAPQVHGDSIYIIDKETIPPMHVRFPVRVTPPADALVTNLAGVGLMIKVADCQSVFLADPVREVVANVHCGWRGSAQGILPKVVDLMVRRFDSRPEDLLAAISPSLGPCCAEFRNYPRELPLSFLPFKIGVNHFDFWAISRWQLEQAGLHPDNIETANLCTVCKVDQFFSYRAAKVTGRMAAVVGWHRDS
ncbi:MAG TPA: peptidoglycan editing factor PgeF [Syntrophobacteraceae bacterium]|nr:peptidoglycan editing factor PgeF [Syntrophobacteraceae bacterium]HBD09766.1 peptidoglycan editing factor PgeF [Syntrophobacteraceae bacterium]HBZ54484.1 peptidoglycan editing factor PgeF [Syntrophobacteraceae bacterium]